MAKFKDTEYLYITSVIRAREPRLLTDARLERMIGASNDGEALRVLEECGFESLNGMDAAEEVLEEYFAQILDEVERYSPFTGLADIFRLKYDYHNAKVLIKAQAAGSGGKGGCGGLLSPLGRYEAGVLEECFYQGIQGPLTPVFSKAIEEARDVLARTKDARQSDLILDKAYYEEFIEIAEESGSDFIEGYCRLSVDTVNFRTAVRASRMGLDLNVLDMALMDGGNVSPKSVAAAVISGEGLTSLYGGGPLGDAAEVGAEALKDRDLTIFEKYCDNALINYLKEAKRVSFGPAPVMAFIAAVENEITSVRIVMNSRKYNLPHETIRERLRDPYV